MKLKIFVTTLTLMSSFVYADVDYSRCMTAAGLWGSQIDNNGNLVPQGYQKIVNKSSNGKVDKYDIETEMPDYGGGTSKIKTQISLERDDQGRVIRIQTGGDKMDKKSIDMMKKYQLQSQVNMTVMNAKVQNGQFGYGMGPFGEMTYAVKDKDSKTSYKKLSDLNKEEREQVGMSEELFKEMKQSARLDKKSASKIEKGLKDLQTKSKPVYYLGQETELEFADGICAPKKISQRMFHTQDNSVHETPVFTKEGCEEVQKLFVKHKESIAKCDQSNKEISKDIFANHDKIKDIINGQSFGGMAGGIAGGMAGGYVAGMGGGMVGGYGSGMIGIGGSNNSLSYMKNYCDMMVGEMRFGTGFGFETPKKSDSSKQ